MAVRGVCLVEAPRFGVVQVFVWKSGRAAGRGLRGVRNGGVWSVPEPQLVFEKEAPCIGDLVYDTAVRWTTAKGLPDPLPF